MDTHIWIWWLTGQKDLPHENRELLDEAAQSGATPYLASISLWEAQMLARKGRLALHMDFADWLLMATDPEVVRILPMDASAIIALDALPESFHGDPADRMIVATAKCNKLPLMTMDQKIQRTRIIDFV